MADGMNQPGPEDGEADAAQAFEALRAEVGALRRGVELLYRQLRDGLGAAAPVDYSPTLGGMAKSLQALEGRLRAIEGKPALELTPARFEDGIRTAGHWAGEQGRAAMQAVTTELVEARREFQDVLAGARTRREQQMWVITAAALGVVAGVLVWYLAAALLPCVNGAPDCGVGGRWGPVGGRSGADAGGEHDGAGGGCAAPRAAAGADRAAGRASGDDGADGGGTGAGRGSGVEVRRTLPVVGISDAQWLQRLHAYSLLQPKSVARRSRRGNTPREPAEPRILRCTNKQTCWCPEKDLAADTHNAQRFQWGSWSARASGKVSLTGHQPCFGL